MEGAGKKGESDCAMGSSSRTPSWMKVSTMMLLSLKVSLVLIESVLLLLAAGLELVVEHTGKFSSTLS